MVILFALVKKVHGKLLMRNDDKDIMEKQGKSPKLLLFI